MRKTKSKSLVSQFGGRFATVQISSKGKTQTVCARFVHETPQYVNLQLVNEGNSIRKFKKTSIRGAYSGGVHV